MLLMSTCVALAAVAIALFASQCNAGFVSTPARRNGLGRWKRQFDLSWHCSVSVNECWVRISCRSNADLDLPSLTCHLDGRLFECASNPDPPPLLALSFRFDANLATLNDKLEHRLFISVRSTHNGQQLTLPWNFRFKVTDCICPPITFTLATISASKVGFVLPSITVPPSLVITIIQPTIPQIFTMTSIPTISFTHALSTTTLTQPPTILVLPTTTMVLPTTTVVLSTTTVVLPSFTTPPSQVSPSPRTTMVILTTTTPPPLPPPPKPSTMPSLTALTPTPPVAPPELLPVTLCRGGRSSAGDLLLFCKSELAIQSVAFKVNGIMIGVVDGDIVTIAYSLLVNGENIIELTIIYTNGQIYILLLLYKKEVSFRGCRMTCSGRYTPGEGLELTCTVDGDSTGEGITSVVYNVNTQGLELAYEVPVFHIPSSHFQQGTNRVEVAVTHAECGWTTLVLQFMLPFEPTVVSLPSHDVSHSSCDEPLTCDIIHCDDEHHHIILLTNSQPIGIILVGKFSSSKISLRAIQPSHWIQYKPGMGMSVKCVVSGELNGGGISFIVYNVNRNGPWLADSLPSFAIGEDQLEDGYNCVELTITHIECGNMNFHFLLTTTSEARRPGPPSLPCNKTSTPQTSFTTAPPTPDSTPLVTPTLTPTCAINCQYATVNDGEYYHFICVVNNDGFIVSVTYTVNEAQSVTVFQGTFDVTGEGLINIIHFNFVIFCNGEILTVEHTLIL